MTNLSRGPLGCIALACASFLSMTAASAHTTFERASASAGSTYKAVLRVPHGCDGEPTRTLTVRIPDGLIAVKPMPKAGWQLATRKSDYPRSHDDFGRPMQSGVTEITWSGGQLADEHYDEFVFQGRLVADLEPGAVLAFPTIQNCGTKSNPWTEVAAPGVDPHSLKFPAPTLRIEAQAKTTEPAIRHGDLVLTAPWTREPPKGSRVAGGFLRITNTGQQPDRLIGGSAPFAKRFEVHEMAVVDGVMRMRELDKGLLIKPGETVELKPGGYHVMFMDITDAPVAGKVVKTRLRFERAGEIEIDLPVQAAPAAAKGGQGHKH